MLMVSRLLLGCFLRFGTAQARKQQSSKGFLPSDHLISQLLSHFPPGRLILFSLRTSGSSTVDLATSSRALLPHHPRRPPTSRLARLPSLLARPHCLHRHLLCIDSVQKIISLTSFFKLVQSSSVAMDTTPLLAAAGGLPGPNTMQDHVSALRTSTTATKLIC